MERNASNKQGQAGGIDNCLPLAERRGEEGRGRGELP